ncbi:MAG: hypothetical protein KAU27_06140 [Desulfuromonadales bacterium]|nr:hypothetical protein [Desulfuromonadales bacterium]
MSSILKALRKIGEEKRVDQHAAPDLRLDQGLTPVKSKPYLPLLIGIALGAVVIAPLFLLASKESAPFAKDHPVVKIPPVSKAQPVATPVETVFVETKVVASVATVSVSPQAKIADQSRKSPTDATKTSVVSLQQEPVTIPERDKKVTSKPFSMAPEKIQSVAKIPMTVEKTSEPIQKPVKIAVVEAALTASSVLPEGVSLVVTEIYHNEDSANSMAVVNDLPVMLGTHVDSAIVVAIRPDSVLFKIDENSYVVTPSNP